MDSPSSFLVTIREAHPSVVRMVVSFFLHACVSVLRTFFFRPGPVAELYPAAVWAVTLSHKHLAFSQT
jgi:hypothetical protein